MQPLELEIPIRTPTMNYWQRMHWSRRKRLGKEIAMWLVVAINKSGAARPDRPIARCRILVERESTQEPDYDGLVGGLKPLLDALQPAGRRHPYGIGLIADDSPRCLIDLETRHIPGKGQRTRIRIEPVE